jgi:hypothetical protein
MCFFIRQAPAKIDLREFDSALTAQCPKRRKDLFGKLLPLLDEIAESRRDEYAKLSIQPC